MPIGLSRVAVPAVSNSAAIGRPCQLLALSCALTLLVATLTFAQPGGAANRDASAASPPVSVVTRDATGKVVVRATRITQPVDIDGRLDDAAYGEVPPMTEFIQQEPKEGAPITEKTEVWLMFDDQDIYVACRCSDQHPERIVANDMRRDGSNQPRHDQFSITVDTFHDRRNGFLFGVTAIGGLRDGSITDERPNFNWNGIWDAKTTRFAQGWMMEMRIPFKTLRYTAGREQIWGLQLRRFMAAKNERAHITPMSPAGGTLAIFYMSQAATLVGLEAPPPALNLEIKPYAVSRMTTDLLSRPTVRNDPAGDAGLDVKYGVTKSLTLDATYNTDFAQVEADEAQVNLTRFSLSLPEKREFFLEGAGIFAFGSQAGGGPAAGDVPTIFYSRRIGLSGSKAVPVIGGARFTGTAGLWNIGAFNMETDDVPDAKVEKTNFTVVRLRRNILRRSTVGGILTRRSVSTSAPGANDVWGLDTNLAFYRNVFFAGYFAKSSTKGVTDGDHSYRAQFSYAGDRYGLGLDRLVVGEHFNPEVGFLRRENFRRNAAQARFSPRTVKNPFVRKWVYQGNFEYTTDNDNHLESRELSGSFETEFHSGNSVSAQYLRLHEFLAAPFQIATGIRIPAGGYSFDNARMVFVSGVQNRLTGSSAFEIGRFYSGHKKTATFNGRFEITPQFGVEPTISFNWVDLPQGEFTNTIVGGRVTYTMSPQMFFASLVQYSSSNSSLLTNIRFRWEYQPGSEFFVVYTEGRTTLPPRGTDLQSRGLVIKINRLLRF
jgi:hypothetical protein